jgi:16S rRNA (cytidine1402-2'-O)-methyltransferase
LKDCLNVLPAEQQLCVAVDLTLETEWICSQPIEKWKKSTLPNLDKRPCLFLIGH